jgi:hypothetical protein
MNNEASLCVIGGSHGDIYEDGCMVGGNKG